MEDTASLSTEENSDDPGCKCSYPAHYPEIRVSGPNIQYARILLEDYSGEVSEFTAIAQYVHHYFVLQSINREIAELLECISFVEMRHLEILGKIISMLGVEPRYVTIGQNNMEKYWDSSYVFYGVSLCDRITSDIAGEWAQIANYRKHIKMIDDPYIRRILERIIMDELHHIDLLSRASQKYCRTNFDT
ncbi:MAG: ferritin-like domain-containing protein [Tepidanaerobacteraceae bacterium]|jgi:bacterioferritin